MRVEEGRWGGGEIVEGGRTRGVGCSPSFLHNGGRERKEAAAPLFVEEG